MQLSPLTAISPIDGRYSNKMSKLRAITSEYGLIQYRVFVEIKWLLKLVNSGYLNENLCAQQQQFIEGITKNFNEKDAQNIKAIEKITNHDVKAVEYFIRDKLTANHLSHLVPYVHFACTSEDINNLAYALMIKAVRDEVLLPQLLVINHKLLEKSKKYCDLAMLSHTHGQTASPTTLGKEFANVAARLQRQIKQLKAVELLGKFNGAVGNYNAHKIAFSEIDWPEFNSDFIKELGLIPNLFTTQIEPHDYIAELLQTLARTNTILLDLARDTWSYISIGYFQQKSNPNEVGSSTMPHKVNPIDFENAEGNLGIANALNEHLALKLPVSRWQRDLSDSTVLRNLGSAFAYSLLAYQALEKGLNKITANTQIITQALEGAWEVLAEAVQTVMRRYGVSDAYEQLKALTRGQKITQNSIHQFIKECKQLPPDAKESLLNLTPSLYTGYAAHLIDKLLTTQGDVL